MHTQTINLREQQQMQDGEGEERGEERDEDGSLRLCRLAGRLEWEDCRSVVPSRAGRTVGWLGRRWAAHCKWLQVTMHPCTIRECYTPSGVKRRARVGACARV